MLSSKTGWVSINFVVLGTIKCYLRFVIFLIVISKPQNYGILFNRKIKTFIGSKISILLNYKKVSIQFDVGSLEIMTLACFTSYSGRYWIKQNWFLFSPINYD